MYRRLITYLTLLTLLLACVPASAESIFTLPTEEEAAIPAPAYAPNYGLLMNVAPVSATTLEDGSLQLVYKPVTDDNFLAFGTLLGERGFTVVSRTAAGSYLSMTVQNEDMAFTVTYHSSGRRMAVTYPEGMPIEQPVLVNPFRDSHVEVELGETLRAYSADQNLFDMTLIGVLQNDEAAAFNGSPDYVLHCRVSVVNHSDVHIYHYFSPDLHWINLDDSYQYSRDNLWYKLTTATNPSPVSHRAYDAGMCKYYTAYDYLSSLETYDLYATVFTPDAVENSNDGIVAMTFTLPGYELPFVLYLRGGN